MADTYARMRQLVGSTLEWAANDLVIGRGELVVELAGATSYKVKIGDGTQRFSSLPYIDTGGDSSSGGASGPAGGHLAGDYPDPVIRPSATDGDILQTVGGESHWVAPMRWTAPAAPPNFRLWLAQAEPSTGLFYLVRMNDAGDTPQEAFRFGMGTMQVTGPQPGIGFNSPTNAANARQWWAQVLASGSLEIYATNDGDNQPILAGLVFRRGGNFEANGPAWPGFAWNATGNAANTRKWEMQCVSDGTLVLGAYNDDTTQTGYYVFHRAGGMTVAELEALGDDLASNSPVDGDKANIVLTAKDVAPLFARVAELEARLKAEGR